MCITISLILSLIFATTPILEIQALTPDEVFNEEFDQYYADFLSLYGEDVNTSLIMALINDTEIVHMKGYGKQPDLDTVHLLGSVGKMFTVTAIMQLYEEGLIDLEDDINDYLPYDLRNPYYPSVPIKIKQLLSYRSTIWNREMYWDFVMNETFEFSDMFYELLHEDGSEFGDRDSWMNDEPGTDSRIAGLPFDLLAYVVEIITSTNFTQYVEENIFTPLGMTNTRLNYSEYNEEKLATPYIIDHDRNIIIPHRNYDGRGSAGWRTTIEDFSKFVYSFMNGAYEGVSILNQSSIDSILTHYGDNWGFGLSVNFKPSGQESFYGISSNIHGFPGISSLGCYSLMFFDDEIGVASLANIHVFDYALQDECLDSFAQMIRALKSLIPPAETTHNLLLVSIAFSLVGILIVHVKRRRNTLI